MAHLIQEVDKLLLGLPNDSDDDDDEYKPAKAVRQRVLDAIGIRVAVISREAVVTVAYQCVFVAVTVATTSVWTLAFRCEVGARVRVDVVTNVDSTTPNAVVVLRAGSTLFVPDATFVNVGTPLSVVCATLGMVELRVTAIIRIAPRASIRVFDTIVAAATVTRATLL